MTKFSKVTQTILYTLLLVVILIPFSSCFKTNTAAYDIIRTDVKTTVTVLDSLNNPIANEAVTWRIHIYNWQTYTDSNMKSGDVTTDSNGQAIIPTYDCQINNGLLVRVTAYTTNGQDVHTNEPASVSFSDANNVVDDTGFAEVLIDYVIHK